MREPARGGRGVGGDDVHGGRGRTDAGATSINVSVSVTPEFTILDDDDDDDNCDEDSSEIDTSRHYATIRSTL